MTTQRIAQRKLVGFGTDLVVTDGDVNYNTAALVAAIVQLNTGNAAYSLIWQMTVPAQQILAFGAGTPSQQRNQGYLWYYNLDETNNDFEDGNLRLIISNARSTRVRVVKEVNTQRLHTTDATSTTTSTPTDINTMIALPEQVAFPKVGENSLLQLNFQTTIPGTTVSATNFSIPATVYQ